MNNRLQEMSEYLEKQSLIYESFLLLAEKKQQALVKGDIVELDKIIQQEQILIIQAGKLEEGRYRLQQELAGHFAISEEEMTLSRLAEVSPGEWGEKLRSQQGHLEEIVNRLSQFNRSNTQLIENSLQFVNYSVALLTRGDEPPVYDGKGKNSEGRKADSGNLFDRRV